MKYHQKTLELIRGYDVALDLARAEATVRGAKAAGVSLPAAVAEWYSIPSRSLLWMWYASEHCPAAWGEFDRRSYLPEDDEFYVDAREDYYGWWLHHRGFWFDPPVIHDPSEWVKGPILTLMCENQSCWQWGIMLDGSPDPPVVITIGGAPWDSCADSFSTYVYSILFDSAPLGQSAVTRRLHVKAGVLDKHRRALREEFQIEPTTRGVGGIPDLFTERFSRPGQRIRFYNNRRGGSSWELSAADTDAFSDLLARLCCAFPPLMGELAVDDILPLGDV